MHIAFCISKSCGVVIVGILQWLLGQLCQFSTPDPLLVWNPSSYCSNEPFGELAFTNDGKYLLVERGFRAIDILDTGTLELTHTIELPKNYAPNLQFSTRSPSGHVVILARLQNSYGLDTGSELSEVAIEDATASLRTIWSSIGDERIYSIATNATKPTVLAGGAKVANRNAGTRIPIVWEIDLATGKPVGEWPILSGREVINTQYISDSSAALLLSSDDQGTSGRVLSVLDFQSGAENVVFSSERAGKHGCFGNISVDDKHDFCHMLFCRLRSGPPTGVLLGESFHIRIDLPELSVAQSSLQLPAASRPQTSDPTNDSLC